MSLQEIEIFRQANALALKEVGKIHTRIKGRIAYVLSEGVSFSESSIASHYHSLATGLSKSGLEVLCFINPRVSWEHGKIETPLKTDITIEKVRYLHSSWPSLNSASVDEFRLEAAVRQYMDWFQIYRPEFIILADDYMVSLPAWVAATRLNIPFFCDISGIALTDNSVSQELQEKCNSFLAAKAHNVFCHSKHVQESIISAGIGESSVILVEKAQGSRKPFSKRESIFNLSPVLNALDAKKLQTVLPVTSSNLPLKSFHRHQSLKGEHRESESVSSNELGTVQLSTSDTYVVECDVEPNEEYLLKVLCRCEKANAKGAVADVTFYDGNGNSILGPYPKMAESKAFKSYFYVETVSNSAEERSYKFVTPENARKILLKIVPFNVENGMEVSKSTRIVSVLDERKKALSQSVYSAAFEQILKEAEEIPDSNGSEYFTKHNLRVGVIGDEYMYNFYKDSFSSVHYLSPQNYPEILSGGLDLVIYTTCWKGINNEEWRGVKFREAPKQALDSILSYAKANNIKTVFQTIEDPSNFDYFLPVAEKFDYVLTTDTDCIERYKKELGHENVFFGEYGVNPQFNNPIGCRREIRNAAFFAGSYPKRYKERCDDMETIFDSIINSGGELLIADRNFGADSEDLLYPQRFIPSVLPPVGHAILQKLHKLFRYNLNFNSIKQSPTMCAMRVYELQAQGNGIISNYANSVFNKFPSIRIIPHEQNMSSDFSRDESWEEYETNMGNVRTILNEKTSYQVVETLLSNIGLAPETTTEKNIAVICKKKTARIRASFNAQSHKNKLLIEEKQLEEWDELKSKHNISYFCWFSEEFEYEHNYLNDLLNGFKFTNSTYITKGAYFSSEGVYIHGPQHEYTTSCSGKALSLFSTKYSTPEEYTEYGELEGFYLANGYSIDPFSLNFLRYLSASKLPTERVELSVIVPVYNNGRFLISKCMPSLQRNLIWNNMEILLVDDGSTDSYTLKVLEELEQRYSNVKVKLNVGKGSGSASRPRNQGMELATAPLLTFLDPDNEISPGAYDLLVDLFKEANEKSEKPVEFISGFHVKVADQVKTIGKHTPNRLSIIEDFKSGYFDNGRFPVIATQSAVLSKEFVEQSAIKFVEKSAGQDTLFGWELIAKANCGGFNGEAHIIYYADRADSITNEVNISYFEKKLILEKEQVKFLKETGVFDVYRDKRFSIFMNDWYLKKLALVNAHDYQKSVKILESICDLYELKLSDYLK